MRRNDRGNVLYHSNDPYRDIAISLLMDSMRYVVKHAIPDEPVESQARGVIKELLFLSHGNTNFQNPHAYHELADCEFLLGKSPYELLRCLLSASENHPKLLDLLGMDIRGARGRYEEMNLELLTNPNTQD